MTTTATSSHSATADPTPRNSWPHPDPSALLSAAGARPDRARGFGPRSASLPDAIPLIGGAPSSDALPLAEITRATQELTSDPSALAAALPYGAAPGRLGLRQWIAAREGVDPDRILVTNGAFHGLSLVFDALLDPGDEVIVEEPTYPLVFRTLQTKAPSLLTLPLTADGADVDALAARLRAGARPKLLYTIPDHHNPTGLVIPAEQRTRLLELAEHYGFVIVSDNAYRHLGFDAAEPDDHPATSDRVVHVRTFSKLLGPGLRIGWVLAPTWLVPALLRLRANHDQHTSGLVQAVVERVVTADGAPHSADDALAGAAAAHAGTDVPQEPADVSRGPADGLEVIARRARLLYGERFDRVARILEDGLPGGIEVDHRTGGIFLWARVRDEGIDLAAAQQLARTRYGTDVTLGRYFYRDQPEDDRGHLRLGISHLPTEQLEEGARRVVAALTDPEARR